MTGESDKPKNNATPTRGDVDKAGRNVFLFVLTLIPLATLVALIYLFTASTGYPAQAQPGAVSTPNGTPTAGGALAASGTPTAGGTPTAAATATASTLSWGAFAPELATPAGPAVGLLIALVAVLIELSLWIMYATFYVNDPENANKRLGLPLATVRTFLLALIVVAIGIFAFLPSSWGDNKAVVLLLGMFTTAVGFYFGHAQESTTTTTQTGTTSGGGGGGGGGGTDGQLGLARGGAGEDADWHEDINGAEGSSSTSTTRTTRET